MNEASLFWDFISFRLLITPSLLVLMYYLGAVVLPVLLVVFSRGYYQKARESVSLMIERSENQQEIESAVSRYRGKVIVLALVGFVLAEIAWRMMFEFLVAYFQIHNALMGQG